MSARLWGIGRWLAGSALGLALALCLATYFGLGGWSSPLPPKPVHETPSPPVVALPKPRIDPSALAQIARHSLFSPQRGMDNASFGSAGLASEATAAVDWTVISIMMTPALTVAVFSAPGQAPVRAKLGETVPGSTWRFARAERRAVFLDGPSGERRLPLRTYDGQGAEHSQLRMNPPVIPVPSPEPPVTAAPNTSSSPAALPPAGPTQNSEAELRQRLAKRRAELQQQTTQGPKP
jgi:general secretion pathway protein N